MPKTNPSVNFIVLDMENFYDKFMIDKNVKKNIVFQNIILYLILLETQSSTEILITIFVYVQ